jgi:hypothetical protein
LQVLDSYKNQTYVNGMAGSIYKQSIPLANPTRKPGEWQIYDVAWTAPIFNGDGTIKTPAYVTVFFNGVLVQNHFQLKGEHGISASHTTKATARSRSCCRHMATPASRSVSEIFG